MQKEFSLSCGCIVSVAGSLLLASCSAPPPAQTTIIVKAPPQAEQATNANGAESAAKNSDSDKPIVEIEKESDEPTARDAEGAAPAKEATPSRPAKSKLLDFYDRIPPEEFNVFGNVGRRSLLQSGGAVVDYKHNFIELRGPGWKSRKFGPMRLWQMTIFPNGDEPVVAVSHVVWPEHWEPGTLKFYKKYTGDKELVQLSDGFFPYTLGHQAEGGSESAFLPRRGLDILVSGVDLNPSADKEFFGEIFRYSSKKQDGPSPFTRFAEAE